jgi:hypothetical protein
VSCPNGADARGEGATIAAPPQPIVASERATTAAAAAAPRRAGSLNLKRIRFTIACSPPGP